MKISKTQKTISQINQESPLDKPIIAYKGNKSKIKPMIETIFNSMTTSIAVGIITGLICCFIYISISIVTNISMIQNDIKNLDARIDQYSQMQTQMESVLDDIIKQASSLNMAIAEHNTISIVANESLLKLIDNTYSSEKTVLNTKNQDLWNNWNLTIGRNIDNGVEYTANDLVKESIVTAYIDHDTGELVVFRGQYDKNNHWDGNCIINRYKNNKLIFIMDAEYTSGELTKYKQVFQYTNSSGIDLWMVSERKIEEYKNSGETWSYFKDGDYEKQIEIGSIKGTDVVDADSFRLSMSSKIEGYYNGYTSNGLYNDNTGHAYLVKYTNEGYIRTLYTGRIKDGIFDDSSNEAWYIVKAEDTDYMYYKGEFHNGSPVNNEGSIFINNLSIEKIEAILKENDFNTDLCWYEKSE